MAVAYTDNIMKNFAASAAIMLTGLVSWAVFGDLEPSLVWLCGMCCVLLAVFNYSEDVKTLGRAMGLLDPIAVASDPESRPGTGGVRGVASNGSDERERLIGGGGKGGGSDGGDESSVENSEDGGMSDAEVLDVLPRGGGMSMGGGGLMGAGGAGQRS